MRFLAVDPGKATGIAGDYDGEFWSCILPWLDAMKFLEEHIPHAALVACEDYRISKQTLTKGADAHWPMGGIGVVTYFAEKNGVKAIKQSPADAKSFATDDKLKRLGWYKTGAGHDNDAARHLLLSQVNAKVFDLSRLMG